MRRVTLGETGISASALGFGCASLGSRVGRRSGLRGLAAALDHGITHFDVAPSYGRGEAEAILGEFIAGCRSNVTLATKFGLDVAIPSLMGSAMMVVGRAAFAVAPSLKRSARYLAPAHRAQAFTVEALLLQAEKSLRRLRTDYVDLLSYHDCTAADARSEAVLEALLRLKERGWIRAAGVATSSAVCRQILTDGPATAYEVLQFEAGALADSALRAESSVLGTTKHGLITYGALTHGAAGGGGSADVTSRMRAAVAENPNGIVLFSTYDPSHLRENVLAASII